jgi:hypothetical protein
MSFTNWAQIRSRVRNRFHQARIWFTRSCRELYKHLRKVRPAQMSFEWNIAIVETRISKCWSHHDSPKDSAERSGRNRHRQHGSAICAMHLFGDTSRVLSQSSIKNVYSHFSILMGYFEWEKLRFQGAWEPSGEVSTGFFSCTEFSLRIFCFISLLTTRSDEVTFYLLYRF